MLVVLIIHKRTPFERRFINNQELIYYIRKKMKMVLLYMVHIVNNNDISSSDYTVFQTILLYNLFKT